MRQKLTAEQKYNRRYYLEHKGETRFEARRAINAKRDRSKPKTKKRRNARLREKWATDAEYRKRISEYQKAWRKKRKQSLKNASSGLKKNVRRKRSGV